LDNRPILTRFFKFVRRSLNGCWDWHGGRDWDEYAIFKVKGKSKRGSRFIYEHFYGPIPKGFQIDHLCRNRKCVNPHHLEVVTPRENTLRGEGLTAKLARQTHCKRGHEFTPENTWLYRGLRYCRHCRRIRDREQYWRGKVRQRSLRKDYKEAT